MGSRDGGVILESMLQSPEVSSHKPFGSVKGSRIRV